MMTRYTHNPGSIVPVPITADALRYLFNACNEMARVNRIHAMVLANEKPSAEGHRKALAATIQLHKHVADQYEALAKEITESKDKQPAHELTIQQATELGATVIGSNVYQSRSQEYSDDLAELERRTTALRAERQKIPRP